MNGFEAARQIRALGLAPMPHLVMVTAYGREELVKAASDAGIEDVLIKPVSPSILFDTVMRVLGKGGGEVRGIDALSPSAIEQQLSTIRGARILLAEDNDLNQQVATEAKLIIDPPDFRIVRAVEQQRA